MEEIIGTFLIYWRQITAAIVILGIVIVLYLEIRSSFRFLAKLDYDEQLELSSNKVKRLNKTIELLEIKIGILEKQLKQLINLKNEN